MKDDLDRKYKIILEKEEKLSKSVAFESIERPEVSAWMIIAPLYMIYWMHRMQKFKRSVQAFSQNFLMTKKWALEGAYEMIQKGISRQEMLERFEQQSSDFANTEELRQHLLLEIDLLLEHYGKLLRAQGGSYPQLLSHAYGTRKKYEDFVDRLQEAERRVSRTAIRELQEVEVDSAAEIASNMEEATERLRKKDAAEIFARDPAQASV